ncbi:esterase [Bifidobacterium ramosum]|nr:esterase [Bifidobacterium ramosum]
MTIRHALYSRGGGNAAPTHPIFLCLHGWGSNERDIADIMRYIAPYNDYVSLRAPIVLEPGPDDQDERDDQTDSSDQTNRADPDASDTIDDSPYRSHPAYAEPGVYAWFRETVPSGDDLDRAAFAAATAIDRWVADNVPFDRDIVPFGFSQGGLLATHLLRIHPERYRAAINLSGYLAPGNVPGTAPADDRLADFDTPVFYTYGKNDAVIPKYELFAAAAWLEEHTWLTTKSYRALGHEASLEEFADLRQWLMLHDITSGVL